MNNDVLLALAIFAVVTSITPGPNNLMLMASGANFGWRRTLPHIAGITIGFISLIVLVGIGLTQIFQVYPLAYALFKIASVTFLLYLSYRIATTAPISSEQAAGQKPLRLYQAALFQWINPKGWAMALSAISAFSPEGSGYYGVAMVAAVFAAVNVPAAGTLLASLFPILTSAA